MDYVYAMDRLAVGDGKYWAKGRTESAGGMAACAAVAIVRLGGEASYYGRRGADAIGDEILESLRQDGVDVTGVRRYAGQVSPHSIVLTDKTGERIIILYGANQLPADPSWLPLPELAGTDAVNGWNLNGLDQIFAAGHGLALCSNFPGGGFMFDNADYHTVGDGTKGLIANPEQSFSETRAPQLSYLLRVEPDSQNIRRSNIISGDIDADSLPCRFCS